MFFLEKVTLFPLPPLVLYQRIQCATILCIRLFGMALHISDGRTDGAL
jgi:hypothetical protein